MATAPVIHGYKDQVLPVKMAVGLGSPRAVGLVLPGAAYTQDRPLLVATREVFVAQGAECLLSERYYGMDKALAALTGEERDLCIATDSGALGRAAFAQAAGRPVWLAGKSIGTTALAHAIKQLPDLAAFPSAWLTPLWKDDLVYRAIEAMGARALVLIGKADPQWDQALADKLAKKKVTVVAVDGADHGMTVAGDKATTDLVVTDLRARLATLLAPA
ncbi:MAG: hypothetical protein FJ102_13320 [Deltaproteobacteria bacterium]|nr:hypothetical protein [Deltaproteobacteria bacterium]